MRKYVKAVTRDDERSDAIEFPEDVLFTKDADMAAVTFAMTTDRVWKLVVRSRTPDIKSFEKVLGVRYGQDSDDVEHVDPFEVSQRFQWSTHGSDSVHRDAGVQCQFSRRYSSDAPARREAGLVKRDHL